LHAPLQVTLVGVKVREGNWCTVTASVCAALLPQALFAVTEIFPEEVPKVTLMLVVPLPELIVEPPGTVQE
jgi:hypothetical protein